MDKTIFKICNLSISEAEIQDELIKYIMPNFNDADANNDQILDLNEFYNYGTLLYDAIAFLKIALRDVNKDNDKIEQNEWDCTFEDIDNEDCDPSPRDQTLVCC